MTVDESAVKPSVRERELASNSPVPRTAVSPEEEIHAVARKFAEQPLLNPDPGVWAVLTAISRNARQRPQGMNIMLSADEHCLGRCVEDVRFQILGIAVSASHCKIFKEKLVAEEELNVGTASPVFLKDTSTNGTFLNWKKLRKGSAKAIQHGDIVSFVAPPHDEKSYAFVYREVHVSGCLANGSSLKRKSEDDLVSDNKKLKGIGIGAPEGPISLDDVRSLQRSNVDLRQQLESHVLSIETLRNENRATIARHENELKELKQTVANSYIDQIKELKQVLESKQHELDELSTVSSQLQNCIKDLNERLVASTQSRHDADEIINSQKVTIAELEAQLDEERNQRREERQTAAVDLTSALQRARLEAQEEIKRQADGYLRQHKQQQEVIIKLQDTEKESRLLVETLRAKLEDARENFIDSEKKVRQLEVQVNEEHLVSACIKKQKEELESVVRGLEKELESQKVAREEAWAKVSALELEIAAAIRDISIEKQRFQGARERIILRETQLRAFYSTTEEISALFAKQQEQLKSMQRTLLDEENYETASFELDLNELPRRNITATNGREFQPANSSKEASGGSTPKNVEDTNSMSADDASVTQNHDCGDVRSQDENTQHLEYTSAGRPIGGFGSDIEGDCTAIVADLNDTERDTEQVVGTESPTGDACLSAQKPFLQKCSNIAGDTIQLDDETQVDQELEGCKKHGNNTKCEPNTRMDDTETGTIRTADLIASEPVGSWAVSTAPSVHGENESQASMGDGSLVRCSDGHASGSQTNGLCMLPRMTKEHQALNAMIEIVAPDFKQQFQAVGLESSRQRSDSMSDAETQDGGNDSDDATDGEDGELKDHDNDDGGGDDDDEDVGGGGGGDDDDSDDDGVQNGNDVMIEDSVG